MMAADADTSLRDKLDNSNEDGAKKKKPAVSKKSGPKKEKIANGKGKDGMKQTKLTFKAAPKKNKESGSDDNSSDDDSSELYDLDSGSDIEPYKSSKPSTKAKSDEGKKDKKTTKTDGSKEKKKAAPKPKPKVKLVKSPVKRKKAISDSEDDFDDSGSDASFKVGKAKKSPAKKRKTKSESEDNISLSDEESFYPGEARTKRTTTAQKKYTFSDSENSNDSF